MRIPKGATKFLALHYMQSCSQDRTACAASALILLQQQLFLMEMRLTLGLIVQQGIRVQGTML